MKYILTVCAALILIACNDQSRQDSSDSGALGYSQPNDPFKNLDPEKGPSGNENREPEKPEEKWYGLDSDEDTVIYELDGKILTSGYVSGTFERIEKGDFLHFVVRDSNDYLHSFFMYLDDWRTMDKYWEGYQPARGHPVTVRWVRAPLMVSDGGAMTTAYQAKAIIE